MARKANEAEAKLANALAHPSAIEALIAHLMLQIAKLKREQYGHSAAGSTRWSPAGIAHGRRRKRRFDRRGSRSPIICRMSLF